MAEDSRDFNAVSFYQYLKEGKLMGVRCRACGNLSAEARPMCPACHSKDVEWHQFSGKATLSTFTCISIVPQRMADKGYGRTNPYCSGVVTLAEGPRISARIAGVDAHNPQNIQTGMELTLDTSELDPEHPALAFRPG
jgi:hypothetical protein